MGNFFTRALDFITPWDRRGESQRRAKKKKDKEQQQHNRSVRNTQPNQQQTFDRPLRSKKPVNVFEDLNQNLTLGANKPGIVPVFNNQDNQVVTAPKPGTIIAPAVKPQLSNDQKKAELQQITTNFKSGKINQKQRSDAAQRVLGTMPKKVNYVKEVARETGGVLQSIARGGEETFRSTAQAALDTENAVRSAFGKGRKVTDISQPKKNTGFRKWLYGEAPVKTYQKQVDEVVRPFQENGQLNKESAGAIKAVGVPLLIGLGITDFIIPGKGKIAKEGLTEIAEKLAKSELDDLTEVETKVIRDKIKNAADENEIKGIVDEVVNSRNSKTTKIPVRKDIPVSEVEGDNLDIPVSVKTPKRPQGPLIRDFVGDAETPGRMPTREEIVSRRFNSQAPGRPDRQIEVVTPRTPEKPFVLDENTIASGQDKVIDDYATMLRDIGEGNGTQLVPDGEGGYLRTSNNFRFGDTKGKRMSKAAWREEAVRQLQEGKADPGIQKAFNDAADPEVQDLLVRGERPDAPLGKPIQVKQVTGIPVTDQNVIPTDLPEVPGTVRATTQISPMQAKSEAVANTPVATAPVELPKEDQTILDNPKQFNKRQVAAARNQRKLARQMAKTQEDTAEALARIEANKNPNTVRMGEAIWKNADSDQPVKIIGKAGESNGRVYVNIEGSNTAIPLDEIQYSNEGFVPTGEFGKSANGGPIQKVSRQAEMQQSIEETSQMSPVDVFQTARQNQTATGGFNRRDIRNIHALLETKRIARGTPEWQEARQILKEDGTIWGQTGALRNYTMRRTADANELVSRYESKIYRLADDPTKIESKWFDDVEVAEDAYVNARDEAMAAYNNFTKNPTSVNAKLYHAAQDAADKADVAAKQVEYSVASKALKGNKDVQQIRELDKLANEADMYQMDAVDASMLSGTGTFIRNFVNSVVGGVEESAFGGIASRIAGKLTGNKVGGGIGKGSISGFGEGVDNLRSVGGARAANAGKNPLEHLKNWATTGNQVGDTVIDSQVKHNVVDHYTQLLKDQGYVGRELKDRASVMARQDPDNLAREYAGAARVAAGLGQGITRNNRIETLVKNVVSDAVSGGNPTPFTEAAGKLAARMTVGFPTAIGRSTIEGVKRFTLGTPTFIKAIRQADPLKRSILIKEGIKQAGTGAMVIPPLFYALGASGAISGAYPEDDETRAQWEREGKTENSIKIGGAWYQLPAYLGAWAVPGLFYASLGRNGGNFAEASVDSAKSIPSLLPTDQASNIMDVVNGRTDLGKFMAQMGAATVRAVTPAGALLNQIAKSIDPTKNDTTSGTNWENFVDKVLGGIPGVNNMAGIPDKVSDTGEVITNPNPLEIFSGAASDVQGGGEARSAEIQQQTNDELEDLTDSGILNDPNLKEVLDGKELVIYNKIAAGKELKEGELEDLKKAFVKGVSQTGTDTAYLEREQYETNLAVLKMKRDLMEADKTVKPSSLKDIDIAIKRGEVYRDNEIPYDIIKDYQDTSLTEWRNMGDPDDDDYNPEMYEKLWKIDELLTEAKVSDNYKGQLDKNKYSAKSSGKGRRSRGRGGRGGRGRSQTDFSFGALKDGVFAPRVQEYDSIDGKAGAVPIIRRVRPNIVHEIRSS